MSGAAGGDRAGVIKTLAVQAGFDAVGIAVPASLDHHVEGERMAAWVMAGRHGTMEYMARNLDRRQNPRHILPGARSVLCVGLNYGPREPFPGDGAGRTAAYAQGRDYHKIFTRRLKSLEAAICRRFPGTLTRRYVDTGPVMEKLWAERAGLGWRGKHTNLVSREFGSWLLLGEIFLDLDLSADEPEKDHCGSCRNCLDACPTGAITGPYQLDANLCISYLTIEHRGSIPEHLRAKIGDHLFGCDDCLDVCPWNRFAKEASEAEFAPRPGVAAPLLSELLQMDDAAFLARFAGTAVMRAKREGLARNACVVLGNTGGAGAVEALTGALHDASPVVREHARWALDRLNGEPGSPVDSPSLRD